MSIRIQCSCGRRLNLKVEAAGKRVQCPSCQRVLAVPDVEHDIASQHVTVATKQEDAANDDSGEIDFGQLAELERSSDTAAVEFRVECPQCGKIFTTEAASSNSKAACPQCTSSFRISEHLSTGATWEQFASRIKTDQCHKCGLPIDAGQVLCDSCAGGMAGRVAKQHRTESREEWRAHGHKALDRLGVIKLWHAIAAFLTFVIGTAVAVFIHELLK